MKIIILAGGSGIRLWPLSQEDIPKQCLKLFANHSLLQLTLQRFLKAFSPEDIFIITNSVQSDLILNQIIEICPQLENQILLEPEPKNTGPAIAFALKYFQEKGGDNEEIFLVAPCDSYIYPEDAFLRNVQEAKHFSRSGKIVLLGVNPHKAETGYGYIQYKPSINRSFYPIEQFIEKPDQKTAEQFVQNGNYLWHSGMFVFQFQIFLEELKKNAPELYNWITSKRKNDFQSLPNISIDYAVFEKSDCTTVLPMDLIWSDIGNWDNLYDLLPKDESNNVIKGNCLPIDTTCSLIIGNQKKIVTSGIEDLIIIDTEDILFIGKRGHTQKIKEIAVAQKKERL